MAQTKQREGTGGHAALVSSGILLTRLIGFVRQWIFAGIFGLSPIAAAWGAAFRIPNMLQTLFGEGVLSASFIPVYSKLLAEGDEEEAGRVAGAVAAILALTTAVLVLLGVLAAPLVTDVIVGGFRGETRELTIRLVRILFPGAGLLVLSAWCLGILNSHGKFFLSYTAPVLWNLAMIATLLGFRRMEADSLVVVLAWGSVAGSALQFGVQLPVVLGLARRIRVRLETHDPQVREVVRNFVPVFISRGVVQISAYVDVFLASYLPEVAVAGLTNAQTLYTLPVSLFGMAVSAAELPAMSSALGDAGQIASSLQRRLNAGLRQIAFFVVPSAMAFLALGGVIAALLLENGHFHHADSNYVWSIVAGSSVGLLASTLGRLYSSTYYALRDTRTPLQFAVIRVALTTGLGYLRAADSAMDRARPALGRCGFDCVGWSGRMGGVHAFEAHVESTHRANGVTGIAGSETLDVRRDRRCRRLGGQTGAGQRTSDRVRRPHPRHLRRDLLCSSLSAGRGRVHRRVAASDAEALVS